MTQNQPFTFERWLEIEDIGAPERTMSLAADEEMRKRIAGQFDLLELKSLTARIHYKRLDTGTVQISGEYKATVVQSCVVTLDPVESDLGSPFQRLYALDKEAEELNEIEFDPDEDDPPEFLAEPRINLGDVVIEQLGLDIPPFPRSEGADISELEYSADESEERTANPFAILKSLDH